MAGAESFGNIFKIPELRRRILFTLGLLVVYRIGAHILADLGVRRVRLLTNNPAKHDDLEAFGLAIDERVPLHLPVHPESIRYLRTKRDRLGHLLPDDLDAGDGGPEAAPSADR